MKAFIGCNVLVTTNEWFYAPDGGSYKAVWGRLVAVHTTEEDLGFRPSARHTNWMVQVGDIMIAGCQCLYVIKCDQEPNTGPVSEHVRDGGKAITYEV